MGKPLLNTRSLSSALDEPSSKADERFFLARKPWSTTDQRLFVASMLPSTSNQRFFAAVKAPSATDGRLLLADKAFLRVMKPFLIVMKAFLIVRRRSLNEMTRLPATDTALLVRIARSFAAAAGALAKGHNALSIGTNRPQQTHAMVVRRRP